LIGTHSAYQSVADLNDQHLNDGQWHQVTLDLAQAVSSLPHTKSKIKNLIIGSWQNPRHPFEVDFQNFSLAPPPDR